MSVSLIYRFHGAPPGKAATAPIATEEVFREHWLPGARALGLEWLPLFETGVKLEAKDLLLVVSELAALHRWLQEHAPQSAALVDSQIERLIEALLALIPQENIDAFIG